jgi:hypothetical protein
MARDSRFALLGGLMMLAGASLLLAFSIALMLFDGPSGLWLLIFAPVGGVLVFAFANFASWTIGLRTGVESAMISAALRRARCPACAYPLTLPGGAPSEMLSGPDGTDERADESTDEAIVRCSECGSAWRSTRLGDRPGDELPRQVVVKPWT